MRNPPRKAVAVIPTDRRNRTVIGVAVEVRRMLRTGGSAEHAKGVQRFFTGKILSQGWRTADLRRAAKQTGRTIQNEFGLEFLVQVADELFSRRVLEEKVFAVLLLENLTSEFSDKEFRLFQSWLDRIVSWSDHDGLVHSLIAPMIVMEPRRAVKVFEWAKSRSRWHRRAACVALIQGARKKMFFPQITRLPNFLLGDEDDMVQKGLGWLLRETAKADPARTIPYLMKIRGKAPRLVLRTACETLASADRKRVLSKVR